MTPQALAALTVALLGVAGCTDHEQAAANNIANFLGEHIPILEDELAPSAEGVDQPTVPEPPAPHVLQPYEYGYIGPIPCDHSIFGQLTCEQGQWHWLNGDFSWAT